LSSPTAYAKVQRRTPPSQHRPLLLAASAASRHSPAWPRRPRPVTVLPRHAGHARRGPALPRFPPCPVGRAPPWTRLEAPAAPRRGLASPSRLCPAAGPLLRAPKICVVSLGDVYLGFGSAGMQNGSSVWVFCGRQPYNSRISLVILYL
jgi:hypothetical protein